MLHLSFCCWYSHFVYFVGVVVIWSDFEDEQRLCTEKVEKEASWRDRIYFATTTKHQLAQPVNDNILVGSRQVEPSIKLPMLVTAKQLAHLFSASRQTRLHHTWAHLGAELSSFHNFQ